MCNAPTDVHPYANGVRHGHVLKSKGNADLGHSIDYVSPALPSTGRTGSLDMFIVQPGRVTDRPEQSVFINYARVMQCSKLALHKKYRATFEHGYVHSDSYFQSITPQLQQLALPHGCTPRQRHWSSAQTNCPKLGLLPLYWRPKRTGRDPKPRA